MNGLKSAAPWIVIFMLFILIYVKTNADPDRPESLDLTRVVQYAKEKKITKKVIDNDGRLEGFFMDPKTNREKAFTSQYLDFQAAYVAETLVNSGLLYEPRKANLLVQQVLLPMLLPILLIGGLWFVIARQMNSGGNKAMTFGKSKARLQTDGANKVMFEDVAGVDEAKEELKEVVDFLKDPQKFAKLGGKIPKGVLLYGPPGTGKTLLAKAVAGEANVPFFSISGSDFVEMFVGVGASRVRDLFEQGKKHKPCLIFMDEIDAVGRHRGYGMGGGHDEREQTLNQLLVEMDGFNANEGIILIAATNRPDVLDPALTRPGRFDRQVAVDYADVAGREQILKVHSRKVKLAEGVNLRVLAKGTPGFSGADLANVINEAALLAARRDKETVTDAELNEAKDRVMMGPERRSLVLTDKEKRETAYHEAGHALCAKYVGLDDEVHKVTIVPRGRSLGTTWYLPNEEHRCKFSRQMKDRLVSMLGGRAAEQVVFGDVTSGAANDLQQVTRLAKSMVRELGMSDAVGPRAYGDTNGAANLTYGPGNAGPERDYSDQTAMLIDSEINKLIEEADRRAMSILTEHRDVLERVTQALMEFESIDGADLDALMRGETLPPRDTPPLAPPPPPPPTAAVETADATPAPGGGLFGTPLIDRPA